MVRVGASEGYFKFKNLTPLYPTMADKLLDPKYWDDKEWTLAKSMKQEKEE